MSITLSQGSYVRTITYDSSLHAKPRVHSSCLPVSVVPYHYVSPALRKKYENYHAIHHPKLQQVIRYPCVGGPGAGYRRKGVAGTPFNQAAPSINDKLCRPHKTLTEKQIRLRIERQTLRDMRKRIHSPPQATKYRFQELEKFYDDHLEEPTTLNKTTQLNCPSLEFKQPEKPRRIGFDQSTQVTSADFGDWDDEITNFVEVITGKITQQCLMEVSHEEELYQLRVYYRQLDESRQTRIVDERDIQDAESKLQGHLAEMLKEQQERKQRQEDLMNRITATVTGEAFIRDLLPPVLEHLHSYGVHLDEVVEEINDAFTDELTEQVT